MLTGVTPDPKFGIGDILFVDILGYSKLLIGEQTEVARQLKQIVANASKSVSVTPMREPLLNPCV
jgi:hypothetical protein